MAINVMDAEKCFRIALKCEERGDLDSAAYWLNEAVSDNDPDPDEGDWIRSPAELRAEDEAAERAEERYIRRNEEW